MKRPITGHLWKTFIHH